MAMNSTFGLPGVGVRQDTDTSISTSNEKQKDTVSGFNEFAYNKATSPSQTTQQQQQKTSSITGLDVATQRLEAVVSGTDPLSEMMWSRFSRETAASESARKAAERQRLAQSGLSSSAITSISSQTARDALTASQIGKAQMASDIAARADSAANQLADTRIREAAFEFSKETQAIQQKNTEKADFLASIQNMDYSDQAAVANAERRGKELYGDTFTLAGAAKRQEELDAQKSESQATVDFNNFLAGRDLANMSTEEKTEFERLWKMANPRSTWTGIDSMISGAVTSLAKKNFDSIVARLGDGGLANVQAGSEDAVALESYWKKANPGVEYPGLEGIKRDAGIRFGTNEYNSIITRLGPDGLATLDPNSEDAKSLEKYWKMAYPNSTFPGIDALVRDAKTEYGKKEIENFFELYGDTIGQLDTAKQEDFKNRWMMANPGKQYPGFDVAAAPALKEYHAKKYNTLISNMTDDDWIGNDPASMQKRNEVASNWEKANPGMTYPGDKVARERAFNNKLSVFLKTDPSVWTPEDIARAQEWHKLGNPNQPEINFTDMANKSYDSKMGDAYKKFSTLTDPSTGFFKANGDIDTSNVAAVNAANELYLAETRGKGQPPIFGSDGQLTEHGRTWMKQKNKDFTWTQDDDFMADALKGKTPDTKEYTEAKRAAEALSLQKKYYPGSSKSTLSDGSWVLLDEKGEMIPGTGNRGKFFANKETGEAWYIENGATVYEDDRGVDYRLTNDGKILVTDASGKESIYIGENAEFIKSKLSNVDFTNSKWGSAPTVKDVTIEGKKNDKGVIELSIDDTLKNVDGKVIRQVDGKAYEVNVADESTGVYRDVPSDGKWHTQGVKGAPVTIMVMKSGGKVFSYTAAAGTANIGNVNNLDTTTKDKLGITPSQNAGTKGYYNENGTYFDATGKEIVTFGTIKKTKDFLGDIRNYDLNATPVGATIQAQLPGKSFGEALAKTLRDNPDFMTQAQIVQVMNKTKANWGDQIWGDGKNMWDNPRGEGDFINFGNGEIGYITGKANTKDTQEYEVITNAGKKLKITTTKDKRGFTKNVTVVK